MYPRPGVDAIDLAAEIAAGQYGYRFFGVQSARKLGIVAGNACPQVERGVGHRRGKLRIQNRLQCSEFFRVTRAIFAHVSFIIPRRDASGGDRLRHGRTVIGAIEQKGLDQFYVARYVA